MIEASSLVNDNFVPKLTFAAQRLASNKRTTMVQFWAVPYQLNRVNSTLYKSKRVSACLQTEGRNVIRNAISRNWSGSKITANQSRSFEAPFTS